MTIKSESHRAGFTLVEVMVAIVILAVGILGLAATASVVTRQMTGAVHQSVAATVAYSRMEHIRSSDCMVMKDSTSGSAVTRNVSESWTISVPATKQALLVTETITYKVRGILRTQVFNSEFPCPGLL